jgi:hypothetical protein
LVVQTLLEKARMLLPFGDRVPGEHDHVHGPSTHKAMRTSIGFLYTDLPRRSRKPVKTSMLGGLREVCTKLAWEAVARGDLARARELIGNAAKVAALRGNAQWGAAGGNTPTAPPPAADT